jgi:hypothetical protein
VIAKGKRKSAKGAEYDSQQARSAKGAEYDSQGASVKAPQAPNVIAKGQA